MKKLDLLNSISAIISVFCVGIAFVSVSKEYYGLLSSMSLSILLAIATIGAAIAAMAKLLVSRNRPIKTDGQIFLIYAREDKNEVQKIYNSLKEKGFKPWMDSMDLLPGQNWQESIEDAIKKSDIALYCISKHAANKKGFVGKEIRTALNSLDEISEGFSPIIPVRLEETSVPDFIKQIQCIDLFKEGGMEKLNIAIQATLKTAAT